MLSKLIAVNVTGREFNFNDLFPASGSGALKYINVGFGLEETKDTGRSAYFLSLKMLLPCFSQSTIQNVIYIWYRHIHKSIMCTGRLKISVSCKNMVVFKG